MKQTFATRVEQLRTTPLCSRCEAFLPFTRTVTRHASLRAKAALFDTPLQPRHQRSGSLHLSQHHATVLQCSVHEHDRQRPAKRKRQDRLVKLIASSSNAGADPAEPDAASEPQTRDWRQFRARLIATDKGEQETSSRWAHNVSKPEKGCILLAHPLMFGNTQSYFSQAVIFLFEHSEEGSAGFILNRPTELTLGKLLAADALLPEFSNNLLYLGGDVGSDTMHFIHGCPDVQGAVEVVQGVFLGGFEGARAAIKTGTKQAEQFRWFNKYAGWGPGQLDQEVTAGVWFTVAASSEVILNHQNLARGEMWHSILDYMGGDYATLSASVKEAYPDSLPRDPGTSGA